MQNDITFVWNQEVERCVYNGIFLEEEVTHSADLVQGRLALSDAWRQWKRFRIILEVCDQGLCLGNSYVIQASLIMTSLNKTIFAHICLQGKSKRSSYVALNCFPAVISLTPCGDCILITCLAYSLRNHRSLSFPVKISRFTSPA